MNRADIAIRADDRHIFDCEVATVERTFETCKTVESTTELVNVSSKFKPIGTAFEKGGV